MNWLILILGIAFNTSASLTIKLAVTPPNPFPSIKDPLSLINNLPFLVGLILYGFAFLFYAIALTRFPLNVAHPILTSGAIAAVTILSSFIFREPVYWTTVVGILMIITGVFFLSIKA